MMSAILTTRLRLAKAEVAQNATLARRLKEQGTLSRYRSGARKARSLTRSGTRDARSQAKGGSHAAFPEIRNSRPGGRGSGRRPCVAAAADAALPDVGSRDLSYLGQRRDARLSG